ncbi:sel1 repeat family protein [Pacificimonas sp. WHA3]|uniref:Sel1 repeat family protein n=1 Tax=Pacificimonas pallii TaxID=2827236 RepID=A0ABS6SIH9_9SPHN|nr:hypothetical protein [Pacificimonas pallii]MBV7257731.1 sel1 repeat family protein [Pacificimonas pallii]
MGRIKNGDARFLQQQVMKAMSGDPDAFYELGVAYAVGRAGVDVDLIEAHKWFNLAALKGDERAKQDRSEVSAEMTHEQISEAQRNARTFLTAVAA